MTNFNNIHSFIIPDRSISSISVNETHFKPDIDYSSKKSLCQSLENQIEKILKNERKYVQSITPTDWGTIQGLKLRGEIKPINNRKDGGLIYIGYYAKFSESRIRCKSFSSGRVSESDAKRFVENALVEFNVNYAVFEKMIIVVDKFTRLVVNVTGSKPKTYLVCIESAFNWDGNIKDEESTNIVEKLPSSDHPLLNNEINYNEPHIFPQIKLESIDSMETVQVNEIDSSITNKVQVLI